MSLSRSQSRSQKTFQQTHLPIQRIFGDEHFTYIFTVDSASAGIRIDNFTKSYLGERISREYIKRKIISKELVLEKNDGRPYPGNLKASTKIGAGDRVLMRVLKKEHLNELESEHWREEKIEIETNPEIIYEDQELIVINKPPFMATYPTGRHSLNCATRYFENIYKQTIYSIHRIDRETSGILLLGKNPRISRNIAESFARGRVRKAYFLIAKTTDAQQIVFPLVANQRIDRADSKQFSSRIHMQTFPAESTIGKEAVTEFRLLEYFPPYLLLLALPQTGRQHQIRVHAAAHGFPLLGDKIYSIDPQIFIRYKDNQNTLEDYDCLEIPRHALHAIGISLPEQQNRPSSFIAPLPFDLAQIINQKFTINLALLQQKIHHELNNYLKTS
ncbi:MAG: RluA family pseudouridine synthase [Oligoflexia bacterium]|nr:RluA family pseudouridine synthase [Oligoflexia bacterium]